MSEFPSVLCGLVKLLGLSELQFVCSTKDMNYSLLRPTLPLLLCQCPFPGAAGYPTYRLGYPQAPPSGLERTPYEAYDPIGKYATATRFSYTSQHSDYGQRFQQRMQTHV